MNIIEALEKEQLRSDIPDFAPGDTVRVHAKIVEGYATCTMPAFETMLFDGQVDAIVAYIRELQGARP